jgi:predicted aspartyl protease
VTSKSKRATFFARVTWAETARLKKLTSGITTVEEAIGTTDRSRSVVISKLLVDSGSEYTWVSERSLERIGISREKKDVAFILANGQEVTRSVGFAIIRLDKFFTIDEVVFAEPGDLLLIGARTLDGLNLTVEPTRRRLVVAGPLPAA